MTFQDDLANLFAYTRWADVRLLDAVRKLTPEQYAQEPTPGWSSIRSTLVHMGGVARAWAGKLDGTSNWSFPDETTHPTVDDATSLLFEAYDLCDRLIAASTPEQLASIWETTDPRGRPRRLPFWAAYRHLANHQTYHRGQIASKLKRLGVDPPVTDFGFWVLEQVPQHTDDQPGNAR